MKQFLGSEFTQSFLQELMKANKSLLIISPYVTKVAVKKLIDHLGDSKVQKLLITLPPGPEYLTGAVELEGIQLLHRAGFEIRCLEDLHAKIYVFNKKISFIGSANFTANGLNLINNKGNIEDMVRLIISTEDFTHIEDRYIRRSKILDPFGEWVKKFEEFSGLFQQYQEFQNKLKDLSLILKSEKASREYVKMYSKYFPPTREYSYNFKFALASSTGKSAKEEKKDFRFELGGSPEKADAYINIPFGIMKKILTNDHLDGANKMWQFQISINKNNEIFLRSTKKDKSHISILLNQKLGGKLRTVRTRGV